MTPNAGNSALDAFIGSSLAAVLAGSQPAAHAAPSLQNIVQNGRILPH